MNQEHPHGSDSSEEDSDERSPPRGRSGRTQNDGTQTEGETAAQEAQVDAQINAMMAENSKSSGA